MNVQIESLYALELLRMIGDDDVFSTSQVGELLGKDPETVRRWCRTGKVQTLGPGHYRISGQDLKRFIKMSGR